jgi:hypothetical protein
MPVSDSEDLTLNKNIVKLYKLRLASYNNEMIEYQIQRRAMIVLIDYIHDTITSDNAIYIRIIESHSWNELRALRERLAPTNATRIMILKARYKKLSIDSESQDMKTYLTEWERVYSEATENKLFEISDNKALRNFFVSLTRRENQYFNTQLMILKSTDSDLLDTIALFWHYIRMRDTENIQQVINNHNAFVAADQAD